MIEWSHRLKVFISEIYILGIIFSSFICYCNFYEFRFSQIYCIVPNLFLLVNSVISFILVQAGMFKDSQGFSYYEYYANGFGSVAIFVGGIASLLDTSIYYQPIFKSNMMADVVAVFAAAPIYWAISYNAVEPNPSSHLKTADAEQNDKKGFLE